MIPSEGADEATSWLEFVMGEELMKKNRVEPLVREAEELAAIFYSSRKTARK